MWPPPASWASWAIAIPAGALSPDGARLAYSEGRHIRVVPTGGGTPQTLPVGEGQVRTLAWVGNDQLVAEDTGAASRWWRYRFTATGVDRQPLWAGVNDLAANDLRQLAWSPDGQWAAALVAGVEGPELWRISADGATVERRRRGRSAERSRVHPRRRHRVRLQRIGPAAPVAALWRGHPALRS